MTDVSGISGAAGTTAPSTTASTATSGAGAAAATVSGDQVTITQRDGSKFTYTIPTVSSNEKGGWVSTPATGMTELAKAQERKHGQSLDADDFLNLLVAQLRYQDPSKPADTAAMMQQTASMAMLERVNELSTAAESMTTSSKALADANAKLASSNEAITQSLGSLLASQSLSSAIGMIGQQVTYSQGGEGATSGNGIVESVRIGASGPILSVNGTDVPIGALTTVAAPMAGTATAATAGTAAAGTAGIAASGDATERASSEGATEAPADPAGAPATDAGTVTADQPSPPAV